MCTEEFIRDEEEDRRMAAFLQSKDYGEESWMTDEIMYQKWVQSGAPVQIFVPKVRGFQYGAD